MLHEISFNQLVIDMELIVCDRLPMALRLLKLLAVTDM